MAGQRKKLEWLQLIDIAEIMPATATNGACKHTPYATKMRIGQGIMRLRTKRIRLLIMLVIILLLLAIVGWLVLHLLVVWWIEGPARPHAEMKEQAEIAMKESGGADVLEKEAKAILSIFRTRPNEYVDVENLERNYPATVKLSILQPPYYSSIWLVAYKKGLPAHVVIRFGSHAHYEYIWMFDPADMPLGKIEGVEHLGGTVYLAEMNE